MCGRVSGILDLQGDEKTHAAFGSGGRRSGAISTSRVDEIPGVHDLLLPSGGAGHAFRRGSCFSIARLPAENLS